MTLPTMLKPVLLILFSFFSINICVGQSATVKNNMVEVESETGTLSYIQLDTTVVLGTTPDGLTEMILTGHGIRARTKGRFALVSSRLLGLFEDPGQHILARYISISADVSIFDYNGSKLWEVNYDIAIPSEGYGTGIINIKISRESGHVAVWKGDMGRPRSSGNLFQIYDPSGEMLYSYAAGDLNFPTIYNISISPSGTYVGLSVMSNNSSQYKAAGIDLKTGAIQVGDFQNLYMFGILDDGTLRFLDNGKTIEVPFTEIMDK